MEHVNHRNTDSADPARAEIKSVGAEVGARSNYGTVPGSEFPVAVYVSVFAAFAWILIASWVAFANDADADLALAFAFVLAIVFFTLPVLIFVGARHHSHARRDPQGDFLSTPVEIATGTLTGASAWLQVLLIPSAWRSLQLLSA